MAPQDVLGRDALIATIWRSLERQSVILSAERRIGKTSVIRKMESDPPTGVLPIYRDLEGIKTPLEFAENVFRDVEHYLSALTRTGARMQAVLKHLGGIQVGDVLKLPDNVAQRHWKDLLTVTIADMVEQQEKKVVLFWDEMPYMLYDIAQNLGERASMEVLDTLRMLRNQHPNLRMVFTGSIGLHNVIGAFKKGGYANAPTNDMKLIDVPTLSLASAVDIAYKLLQGERVDADDVPSTAHAIAEACDGNAFYVQFIVDRLAQRGEIASVSLVKDIVEECLTDPQDGWHMAHYRERIDTYYTDSEDRRFALAILDSAATSADPLGYDALFNHIKSKIATDDQERARDILKRLQRDHYLVQDSDGTYRFRFPLIRRSWRLQRGLSLQEDLP
ncbi:MAG: ATP-binding protein [Armatimonadota bacterium]|nr:ATP-binding protein [Armatimonadota bacterium]